MPVNKFTSFTINTNRRISCVEISKSKNIKKPTRVILQETIKANYGNPDRDIIQFRSGSWSVWTLLFGQEDGEFFYVLMSWHFFCFCLEVLPAEGYSATFGQGLLCPRINRTWTNGAECAHRAGSTSKCFLLFLFIPQVYASDSVNWQWLWWLRHRAPLFKRLALQNFAEHHRWFWEFMSNPHRRGC